MCLYGGGQALVRGLDFTSRLHGKSQPSYNYKGLSRLAASTALTISFLTRNPESYIWVQVFILQPTHLQPTQTELVK